MKVLWIVNVLLGPTGELVLHKTQSGAWLDALCGSFKNNDKWEIIIATTAKVKTTVVVQEDRMKYYVLPDEFPIQYNENKKSNIEIWKKLLNEEKPNLIQVFGTEFTHGLCALRQANGIPSIIYMQGYVGSIARYYLAGLTDREIRENITFRDIIKKDNIYQQQNKYFLAANKEKEMIKLAGKIMSENEWCNSNIRAIVFNVEVFHCPLSVNSIFTECKWSLDNLSKHSIICTASGYPLKGLHLMIKAIDIIRKRYPDVKLNIPGPKMVSDGSLQWNIRKRGYTKYIEQLIKKLQVEDNIIWLGHLTQNELALYYSKSSIFVLTSSIENHSSSLKEAMMVGVPCIASSVGGIPEYVKDGINGFLYRFEEYEIMAEMVERLFEDTELCQTISVNARSDMKANHDCNDIYKKIDNIYESILAEVDVVEKKNINNRL